VKFNFANQSYKIKGIKLVVRAKFKLLHKNLINKSNIILGTTYIVIEGELYMTEIKRDIYSYNLHRYDYDEIEEEFSDQNIDEDGLCQQFANILNASILTSEEDLCAVTFNRNIEAEIAGRPTRSPLALAALFSFESMDNRGRTLNLGETVILQREINPFITALRERGIEVTALHNHWLFDRTRLFYIHFFSIEDPITFARKVAEALRILRD
jgi:hypothetical protein